jgi:tRNA wybutosine-synthesizing protein 4
MMAHFEKLQTPLMAVQKYPSITDQRERFKRRGWPSVSVCNLWELWSSAHFATDLERKELDKIEPFDEWEEFSLFGCHYFLLVADTASLPSQTLGLKTKISKEQSAATGFSEVLPQLQLSYEDCPSAQGRNRFAAATKMGQRPQDAICVFGGMGLVTRVNSLDVYTADEGSSATFHLDRARIVPTSRMCHTITEIDEEGGLLVGGRTSPDNALADCWIFHKW